VPKADSADGAVCVLRPVRPTDQTFTCAARAHVATAARRTTCLHVSRAMQAARRRADFDFTSRLGRRAEAGPRQVLRRVRPRHYLSIVIVVAVQLDFSHLYYRTGSTETCLAESHAAAVKHDVITIEKTIGMTKRYRQLTIVIAAKQSANAHAVPRMSTNVAFGRPPSCQANIAANR